MNEDEIIMAPLDLAKIPRARRPLGHQRGWVEKTGKKRKVWTGFWYEYVTRDSLKKRMQRCKVLGPCAEFTKREAEGKLYDHIRELSRTAPERKATFDELARWYLKTVKGRVSKQWYCSLCCLFERQICPRVGTRIAAELKKSEIQQAVNDIAADPKSGSKSIVRKCLTHIRLGGHPKTGHMWSLQNRPMKSGRDKAIYNLSIGSCARYFGAPL